MGLDPADVGDAVQLAHAAVLQTSGGGNATYIPYLAKVPAQLSAVCAVTPTFGDPLEALDVYTRQCSTLITCFNLATMAATLANHGVNPLSGVAVVKRENVPRILAEMVMEGLYDTSGDWAFEVGLPGKSGVGGGIMEVAPGRLGIAGFAPPLDACGNSVRAQVALAHIEKRPRLNVYGD